MTNKTHDCWDCQHSYTDYHDDHGHLVVLCERGEKTSRQKECDKYNDL